MTLSPGGLDAVVAGRQPATSTGGGSALQEKWPRWADDAVRVETCTMGMDETWIEAVVRGASVGGPQVGFDAWAVLRVNARLQGSARIGRGPEGVLELRADRCVALNGPASRHEAPTVEDHVAALHEELQQAHRDITAFFAESQEPDEYEVLGAGSDGHALARLCSEAGWGGSEDGAGGVLVWIDAGTPGGQARLTLTGDARLQVIAPLAVPPIETGEVRAAIAHLLLRVSSEVRGVKGVLTGSGDDVQPGIASAWAPPVEATASVDPALAAVAVACSLVRREAAALSDAALAREYLASALPALRAGRP